MPGKGTKPAIRNRERSGFGRAALSDCRASTGRATFGGLSASQVPEAPSATRIDDWRRALAAADRRHCQHDADLASKERYGASADSNKSGQATDRRRPCKNTESQGRDREGPERAQREGRDCAPQTRGSETRTRHSSSRVSLSG